MSYQGVMINPKKFHSSQIKFYLILIPLSIFMILPLIYIVCHSLKPLDELFAFPPQLFVKNPTINNFVNLFEVGSQTVVPMTRYLFNSILVTIFVVVGTWIITISAGYALSKKKFKLKNKLLALNQAAMMFVATAVVIPRYFIVNNIGLSNNIFAHIFPLLAMPVGLFLIKQFMDQVPDELIEAAYMDGANDFQIILRVIVPIIKPAIATVGILAFQQVWTNVETSNIYITDETLKTFAFYMSTLTSSTAGNTIVGVGMQAAATVLMFLPNLIIFILMQSKVMATMAHSGIK
jgi:multiple sugar transport system permease protein